MPVAREGYHVPCRKHSDCYPCGRHPLTGQVCAFAPEGACALATLTPSFRVPQLYSCQKRHVLYDTVYTDDDGGLTFVNVSGGSSNIYDIDMEEGADNGKTGFCVDLDSSMNEGCGNPIAATIKDGLVSIALVAPRARHARSRALASQIGCTDGQYVGPILCGLSVDIKHGDISTVALSGSLFWPRLLLESSEDKDGDGVADGRLLCYDPSDCLQKCLYLEKTSRHGAGAPPTCALYAAFFEQPHLCFEPALTLNWRCCVYGRSCNQACTSNLINTVMDIKDGLWQDILTVGRLIATCIGGHGLAGCICQMAVRGRLEPAFQRANAALTSPPRALPQLTLQPEWRKVSTNPIARCENGDPFELILEQLDKAIIGWVESTTNNLIGDANDAFAQIAFGWRPLDDVCIENPHEPDKCRYRRGRYKAIAQHWAQCEDPSLAGGLDMLVRSR